MGLYAPDMPDPVDPAEAASAQTTTNVSTALANTLMGLNTENTPYGSRSTEITNMVDWTDPQSGLTYQLPQTTTTQTLSDGQQDLFDNQTRAESNLAGFAADQSARLGGLLSDPINLDGAPTVGTPQFQTSYDNDFSEDRDKVEAALMERMEPYLAKTRAATDDRMSNSGIKMGSDIYHDNMESLAANENDARLAAILGAGQEQSRLRSDALQAASFGNTALQQQYGADTAARDDFFTEAYAARNQPINEIAALLGTGQVTQPSFTGGVTASMPTVDYAGLMNTNWNQQATNAQAEQSGTNAMLGGLFGLGASGISAYPWGG